MASTTGRAKVMEEVAVGGPVSDPGTLILSSPRLLGGFPSTTGLLCPVPPFTLALRALPQQLLLHSLTGQLERTGEIFLDSTNCLQTQGKEQEWEGM